jgi:glycerophosphoryl diester phosphodiesterase
MADRGVERLVRQGMAREHGGWLERRVLSYAHRGGALEAPASTIYAIERAVTLGATGIELDVHATLDGVLVVSHDATVDGSTNGSGAIATLPLETLRALDHAYVFVPGRGDDPTAQNRWVDRGRAPGDPRFGIATLDEALEASRGAVVNIDIKAGAPQVAPYEEAVALAVARHGREDEVIVTSFDDHRTEVFAAFAPRVATSPGIGGLAGFIGSVRSGRTPAPLPAHHVALQLPYRFGGHDVVDERLMAAAHDAGLAVHVWTVNDRSVMDHLIDLGVDGIMSDVPTVLVEAIDTQGKRYRP